MTDAPLSHVRVLELTSGGYDFAGKVLADLGADVIKIEAPGGCASRALGPFVGDRHDGEHGVWWLALNTGKRSITLDLSTEPGCQLFDRLLARARIVLEARSPWPESQPLLDAERLRRRHPHLIWTRLTPFGVSGPYAQYQATDIVTWSMGGMQHLSGDPARPPVRVSLPQSELVAAANAVAGTMLALWQAEQTGAGQVVDVSTQATIVPLTQSAPAHAELAETVLARSGAFRESGYVRLRLLYPCRDGFISYFNLEGPWGAASNGAIARWMAEERAGPPAIWAMDWPAWRPTSLRRRGAQADAERLIALVEDAFGAFFLTKSRRQLFERAREHGIFLGPCFTVRELFAFEHFIERGFWQAIEGLAEDGLSLPGPFVRFGETPTAPPRRAPRLGEHNAAILGEELGASPELIAGMGGAQEASPRAESGG